MNLNVFRGKAPIPKYRLMEIPEAKMQTITVAEETTQVRPLVAGAILRDLKFTPDRYESFISLQDHLHRNLARMRTLVSIGTHDLDTITGPFTYEAHAPSEISFVPLNQTKEMNADRLMTFYEKDKHLGKYLHIIREKPVYPVIYDSSRVVCSLPPIINVRRAQPGTQHPRANTDRVDVGRSFQDYPEYHQCFHRSHGDRPHQA